MTGRYAGVVFDYDGTLVDTVPLIVASHDHALRTVLGHSLPESQLRAGIGTPLIDQMRVFAPDRADELLRAYLAWNHANTARLIARFDGIDEVLAGLARAGIPIGVATSKMRAAVGLCDRAIPLRIPLDQFVCFEDTAAHKPGPEPLLEAFRRIEVMASRGAYVGDAPFDLVAARAAGCAAIGVTWGMADRDLLASEAPDALCDTPADLLAYLVAVPGG